MNCAKFISLLDVTRYYLEDKMKLKFVNYLANKTII